jgi:hypothetical protein
MRSVVVAFAGLLILAGCAGKPDDPPASAPAAADPPGTLPEGQSAVMPGPYGPVLHIGRNQYPLYPPP